MVQIGGRGSSSGMSDNGKPYGTEFSLAAEGAIVDNIKFIRSNSGSAKTPMETMTKGRIYATVNDQNQVKAITLYDSDNKRYKQIDIRGPKHEVKGVKIIPHTHQGYEHDEKGTRNLTKPERKLVHKVLTAWEELKDKTK